MDLFNDTIINLELAMVTDAFCSSDEENMKPVRIAVVGAGAVGLSTALCIQDRIRNCDVHIIAEKFSPSTTSDGSAGLWTPFLVPQDQIDIVTWVGV